MTHDNHDNSSAPKGASARRAVLFASVAAIGLAVAGAGLTNDGLSLPSWTTAAHAASVQTAPTGFADLVAKVKPAVISVRVKIDEPVAVSMRDNDGNNRMPEGMQKFFQQFGMPGMPSGPNGAPRKQIMLGEGSGFFISPDGYAVTNNHVVAHAENVQVTTDDGTTYKAKVIGTDPKTDLALIKVESNKTFPYVQFAEHEPRIGDWVVAVGNPFGLGGTVTAGIVSARGRDIGAGPYDDYIQIDAPINKGNSGGPAFNANGNVIGINTAIFSPSGGSVGIGFDIPAATAKMVVAQLKEHGFVNRAWLGVSIQPVTSDIADSLGLKTAEGAIVDQPQAGSPAAKAGIEAGDVITAVNGAPIKDARHLARKIGSMAPNTSIKLTLLRNGEVRTQDLVLGKMPNERQAKADTGSNGATNAMPHLGLTLAPAGDVAGAGGKGVAVVAVDPDGPAAASGFATGDVILDVGGHSVASNADVRKAIADAHEQGRHAVLMRVKTADATRFMALPLGKA
ncbi:MAG: Do family serine endopeptidase [Rhodopseudomonas sp.]|nr:Do family serine endopeptidase [Rhodopseudomonas sp.]